jgi:hypothetical protein
MYLSNAVLGDFIAKCLFGKKWEEMKKFVIPRKGNFVNPQQISLTDTYAIYYIEKKQKRLVNSSDTEYKKENAVTTHYATIKSTVRIQFIGKHAEEWADSLLFWDERTDVQAQFLEYDSELLLGQRDIITVPFQQDGYNGEMSYLASFSVLTGITKEEIIDYLTDLIYFEGTLKVEK